MSSPISWSVWEAILLSPMNGHNYYCQCNWLTVLLIIGCRVSQIQCYVSEPVNRINQLGEGRYINLPITCL